MHSTVCNFKYNNVTCYNASATIQDVSGSWVGYAMFRNFV